MSKQRRLTTITEDNRKERVVLIVRKPARSDDWEQEDLLTELRLLADTAGAEIVHTDILRRMKPNPVYFIGRGKAEELRGIAKGEEADLVILNDDLTPAQQRNLEEMIDTRVIDRTQLILDIFAQRAQSKEGKLQIELAQLNYLLPRLTGRGVELSQIRGGIGLRGPGEPKLEMDRRNIRRRITKLKEKIEEVRKHRSLQRKGRKKLPFPIVSLVGYTNSGKSTLLNALAGSSLNVEDKLFATLDPTIRKVAFPSRKEALFSDTVGFIRHLPHHLVAAFKATLEEVTEADGLILVLDGSHPKRHEQNRVVFQVLSELQAMKKPMVIALNKTDLIRNKFEQKRLQRDFPEGIPISALRKEGLDELMIRMEHTLSGNKETVKLLIPQREGTVLASIRKEGKILREEYRNNQVYLEAELGKETVGKLRKYLKV